MRRINRLDLAATDIATLPLPLQGEQLIHDQVTKGLALRLRASGSRTWIILSSREGKTVRQTLGDAATMPCATARLLHGGIGESDVTGPPASALFSETATIGEVMSRYVALGVQRGLAASTCKMMEAVARLHIMPAFGDRPVRDVGRGEIMLWHADLARRTASARMALSTLSGMMRYAEDHGLRDLGSNPCRGLRKKSKAERGSHLPPAAIQRLWAALDGFQTRAPHACDAIRLLLLTGARKREILCLEWDRIEGARAVLEQSKAGPRTVWLNAPARNVLERRRNAERGPFVFPAPRRSSPISSIDPAWAAIRKAAGLPGLRLHDLRHHYASVGVSNGIDLKLVGALLGHHDIDSTLIYAHLATTSLVKSASRVSGLIERATLGEAGLPRRAKRRSPLRSVLLPATTASGDVEARHG